MAQKKDYNVRDNIIFGENFDGSKYFGGTRSYSGLTAEKVKELLELGFLDPEDAQNDSPTAEEFYEFMEKNPQFKAHGYAVTPSRSDVRVTIEGIECYEKVDESVVDEFINRFRTADDFYYKNGDLYCWWD